MSALGSAAYLFTLSPADLGLSLEREDPSGLYSHEAMTEIYSALERVFSGPLYAVAEVGGGDLHTPGRGRLHLHVIAHREDGPRTIRRDTERCKPVTDPLGLYRYLAKQPEPLSLAAEMDLSASRALSLTGKPPRTRRHFLAASRIAWALAHYTNDQTFPVASHCSIEPNAPETSSAPPLRSLDQDPARATPNASPPPVHFGASRPDPLLDPLFSLSGSRSARAAPVPDQASGRQRPRTGVRMVPTTSFSYALRRSPPATPQKLVRIPPKPLPGRILQALRRWKRLLTSGKLLITPFSRLGANGAPFFDPLTFNRGRKPAFRSNPRLRPPGALRAALPASGRPNPQTREFSTRGHAPARSVSARAVMRLSVERITMLDKTQKAAALLLASYSTPEEISRRLQIPPENLQEYQKDPEFSEAVASARSQAENTAEKSVQREALYAFGATAAELA